MTRSTSLLRALIAGLVGLALCFPAAITALADNSVPYSDPAVTGYVGFCNEAGQPVRQGKIADKPFVWVALSSAAAPAPYDGAGRTATLFAFQPRPNVAPGQWSGQQMTATSKYTNAGHPMVQGTHRDFSVADLIDAFPPKVNGLYQIRILLGAPNQATLTHAYPATDIRVTGDSWAVVRGGDVPCNSGTAVSAEVLLPSSTVTANPSASASPGATAGTASPGSTASGIPGASVSPGSTGASGATSTASSSPAASGAAAGKSGSESGLTGGNTAALLVVGVAIVGLLAGGVLLVRYRGRRSGGTP